MPSVEVAVTVPSSRVTITPQSAPSSGHVKRTPPTSRCSPAGTLTVPSGLAVNQAGRSCMAGRPTACTGGGATMAVAMPSVEVAVTVPSSSVTITAQSAPPSGHVKRTPPTSRYLPAGTLTVPPGLAVSQAGRSCMAGRTTACSCGGGGGGGSSGIRLVGEDEPPPQPASASDAATAKTAASREGPGSDRETPAAVPGEQGTPLGATA